MSTRSTEGRLDEMHEGTDRLVGRARADALRRQEGSARAAVRGARAREVSEHAHAAEFTDTKHVFVDLMDAYLDQAKGFFDRLEANASAKAGSAREQAEAAIGDLQRSREKVVERLAELRDAPGDRWRERKKGVAAARARLEREVDRASRKFE